MKKYKEASDLLTSTCEVLSNNNDATSIDEILVLRAGIAYDNGKMDEALSYLNKAKKVARKDRMKEKIDAYIKNIEGGKKVSFD